MAVYYDDHTADTHDARPECSCLNVSQATNVLHLFHHWKQ